MAVNYFLNTIGSDVEALNNYATFRQATADNELPIPGYLIEEVNAISYENNGSNCKALIDYFISRLQSTESPLVKIKVLKLLLVLVKNGHKNILEELKLHEVALKHAQSYSGSLDSVQDTRFKGSVQNLAKELLTVIFSDDISDTSQLLEMSKMTGLGSEASVSKFPGFGNAAFNPKSLAERVTQQVSQVVEKILSPNDDSARYKNQAKVLSESLPHYNPVNISKDSEQDSYLENLSSFSLLSIPEQPMKAHIAGKAGGGWEDDDDDHNDDAIAVNECASKSSVDESSSNLDLFEKKTDLPACSEYLEEQDLVDSFTVDQPLEVLKWNDIDSLRKKSRNLNCYQVCELLVDSLSSDKEENVKMRALIYMEYLLHHEAISPDSLMRIALPKLLELENLPRSAVQIKAKKLGLIVRSLNGQPIAADIG